MSQYQYNLYVLKKSIFKKGEPFIKILHVPQSKLCMNCTKPPGDSAYPVQAQSMYNVCTVYVQLK